MHIAVNTGELTRKIVANNPAAIGQRLQTYRLVGAGFQPSEANIFAWLQSWSASQTDINAVASTLRKVLHVSVNPAGPYADELVTLQGHNQGRALSELLADALVANYNAANAAAPAAMGLPTSVAMPQGWLQWTMLILAVLGLVWLLRTLYKKFNP